MVKSPTLKDIVVFLDGSPASDARLDVALDIACDHSASLVGAYIAPEAILGRHPDEFARGAGVAAVVAQENAKEDADVARIAQSFVELTRERVIDAEWRLITRYGTAADVVLRARHADLSIVGQFITHESNALWRPEDLLFAFGGPTLIVPQDSPRSYRAGVNILVAWDSSREAKRAVADAMPFLMSAKRVTILVVDPPDATHQNGEAGEALARRLGRRDIHATVVEVAAHGKNIGQVIIEQSEMLGADLIVMGAYGHRRIVEMVFGGATRTVLGHMTVPVLMSH